MKHLLRGSCVPLLATALLSFSAAAMDGTSAHFMEVQTSASDSRMAAADSFKTETTSISLPVRIDFEAMRRDKNLSVSDEAGHELQLRTRDSSTTEPGTSLTWHGQVLENGEISGSATITASGDRLHARISSGDRQYRVISTPDGNHYWQRVRFNNRPAQHPPGGPIRSVSDKQADFPNKIPPIAENNTKSDNGPATVDIMAQYTTAAIDAYPDEAALRLAIRNAVETTNTALANNGVSHQVRLMGIHHTDFSESPGGMPATLPAFAESDTTSYLHEYYKADLNALFGVFTDYCGIAYLPPDLSSNFSYASSATNVNPGFPCMDGTTTAHEIGHNLGLEHNPEDAGDASSSIFPYGFGHVMEDRFNTIMAYHPGCGGGVYYRCQFEIPYFSDPEQFHPVSRLPLGIHGKRDNVEALNSSMPVGAQWREPGESLSTAWGYNWHTSGDGLWRAVQLSDSLSLRSGIISPGEVSRVTLQRSSTLAGTLSFTTLSVGPGNEAGTLTVSTDGQALLVLDELGNQTEHSIELPEGTQSVHFDWQSTARASQTSSWSAAVLKDVSDSANRQSSGGGGCQIGVSSPFDPLLLLLSLIAAGRLLRPRQ